MTWPDLAAVAVRAISIGLTLEAAGAAFFLFGINLPLHGGDRARLARLTSVAAVFTVLQQVVMPARLAGSFGGILDGSLQSFYLGTDAGAASVYRILGLLLILAGLAMNRRYVAIGGALIACISFALMGHTVMHGDRWALAPLLLAHVTIVAFWFGSLRPLLWHRTAQELLNPLARFSALAVRIVPLILVAGVGLAIMLLPSFDALLAPYGYMVVAKVIAFAALTSLAAVNRWRLTPRIRAGDAEAVSRFHNVAGAEWLLIWLVVVVTVVVTSFYSPAG